MEWNCSSPHINMVLILNINKSKTSCSFTAIPMLHKKAVCADKSRQLALKAKNCPATGSSQLHFISQRWFSVRMLSYFICIIGISMILCFLIPMFCCKISSCNWDLCFCANDYFCVSLRSKYTKNSSIKCPREFKMDHFSCLKPGVGPVTAFNCSQLI